VNLYFVTLFPEQLRQFFLKGLLKKAVEKKIISAHFVDLRAFGEGQRLQVDDYPFSKKLGMLLKADVVYRAITSLSDYSSYEIIYTCPKGSQFDQKQANSLAKSKGLIFLSGYYEGIDERIFELLPIKRISIGDFILSSGDGPSLLMAEAVTRLIPEVVGKQESIQNDSIISQYLEHPHYTLPRHWKGIDVPDILLSGNHAKINQWQFRQSLELTLKKRPDLLAKVVLTEKQKHLMTSILKEEKDNE